MGATLGGGLSGEPPGEQRIRPRAMRFLCHPHTHNITHAMGLSCPRKEYQGVRTGSPPGATHRCRNWGRSAGKPGPRGHQGGREPAQKPGSLAKFTNVFQKQATRKDTWRQGAV